MARVFLVDDHTIVREGLQALLVANGHQVVGESDEPVGALQAIRGLRPDVVLVDLMLDGHSGFELLSELQRYPDASPCIVLTMSCDARDIAEAARLGAAGYLRKDAPRDQLLEAIEVAARGGTGIGFVQPDTLPVPFDSLASLSSRERQIVAMVVRGRTSASIGEQLGLSRKTVETYRSRLMTKLGVHDVTALVRLAAREGLIGEE